MKNFFNLFGKELKDLITLRMLLPFTIVMVLMLVIGRITRREIQRADMTLTVGVVDRDGTAASRDVIDAYKNKGYRVAMLTAVSPDTFVKEAVREQASVVIVIPPGFAAAIERRQGAAVDFYSIVKSLNIIQAGKSMSIRGLLSVINMRISEGYIRDYDPVVDPAIVKNPITANEFVAFKDRVSRGNPETLLQFVLTQTITIPIALFLLIIMTGTMIASSIGQEKENKTLETLLTVPILRFSIVAAKMLAASVLALAFAFFYMLTLGSYMSSLTSIGGAGPAGPVSVNIARNLGMVPDWRGNLLIGTNIFLAIIAALSLATLLALFARDAKDAQATIAPLVVALMIPYFFSMFFDPMTISLPLRIFIFLIPFSHTFFALKFILLGQYMPVVLGLAYLTLFSLGLLLLAAHIFSSDKILTARLSFLKSP